MHVLGILVENEPGVLARIAGVFGRRGFNIESLAVGACANPGLARMTVRLNADERSAQRLCRHIDNLINVLEVKILPDRQRVSRELALIKVYTGEGRQGDILSLAEEFGALVVDVGLRTVMLEICGSEEKVSSFIQALGDFTILEVARTGEIALTRGRDSLGERNTEAARSAAERAIREGGGL